MYVDLTEPSHLLAEPNAATLYSTGEELFLHVEADQATLVHDEHGPIELPRGHYRVWRQREYSSREIRVVQD